ncbi:MAG: SRPBCC domain-containing protein [Bacteroidales bacterium]|nr:SRPBCC domain-containing protein [Bacteroidales bacterium]
MAIKFEVSGVIAASTGQVYNAWLNSEEHTKMTGGKAEVSDVIGATFRAWDGYIEGTNLELDPGKRILQNWRTTEFEESDEDSLLEILFEPESEHTRVTIRHSNLPGHGMQYKQGWIDNYFEPMNAYFRV